MTVRKILSLIATGAVVTVVGSLILFVSLCTFYAFQEEDEEGEQQQSLDRILTRTANQPMATAKPIATITPTAMITIEESTRIVTSEPEITAAPTPRPTRTPLPTPIDAIEFRKEYRGNQVRADVKYSGKTIWIRGIVGIIDKDWDGNFLVSLVGSASGARGIPYGYMPDAIVCRIHSGWRNRVAQLEIGDTIVVSGIVQDIEFGEVALNECLIKN